MTWNKPEDLIHEEKIVWLDDIEKFDYVRESLFVFGTRRRPIRYRGFKTVGYSVLKKDAPNCGHRGEFFRRVFWVKSYDRSESADDVYSLGGPTEAVDPRTVIPGVPGTITNRAWGSPLKQTE